MILDVVAYVIVGLLAAFVLFLLWSIVRDSLGRWLLFGTLAVAAAISWALYRVTSP